MKEKFSVIILAAGKGSRMGGNIPKVLKLIYGKPILFWTLKHVSKLDINNVIVVTGYKSSMIEKVVQQWDFHCKFVKQPELLGTAHAVLLAISSVKLTTENLLVLFGDDSSLYTTESLSKFMDFHLKTRNKATFLVTKMNKPTDIGGLEIDTNHEIKKVMGKNEMIEKGLTEHYVLCGAFCFNLSWLKRNIKLIPKTESSGEYPLPGLIKVSKDPIKAYFLKNNIEWNSVNTEEQLEEAKIKMQFLNK